MNRINRFQNQNQQPDYARRHGFHVLLGAISIMLNIFVVAMLLINIIPDINVKLVVILAVAAFDVLIELIQWIPDFIQLSKEGAERQALIEKLLNEHFAKQQRQAAQQPQQPVNPAQNQNS